MIIILYNSRFYYTFSCKKEQWFDREKLVQLVYTVDTY